MFFSFFVFLFIEEFSEEQYEKWNRSWFLNYNIREDFIRSNEAINFLYYEIASYETIKLNYIFWLKRI